MTIEKAFWSAVGKTINKFRENPYYFFTESDIHSYFYHAFYSGKFEEHDKDGKRIYLAHREYPTNFRYNKDKLLEVDFEPYKLASKKGDRGNYDIAILNPDFVKNAKSSEEIINKEINLLLKRVASNPEAAKKELLYAVEFKYVISNKTQYIDEMLKDNQKLKFALNSQAQYVLNLVFCNKHTKLENKIETAMINDDVPVIFVNSYYMDNGKKTTPMPILNKKMKKDAESLKLFNKWLR